MVRTRSKKVDIDIAEDQSALAAQIPLPATPIAVAPQPRPLATILPPNYKLPVLEEDPSVELELKGLKAAFRMAVGAPEPITSYKKTADHHAPTHMYHTSPIPTAVVPPAPAQAPWSIPLDLKAHIVKKGLVAHDEVSQQVSRAVCFRSTWRASCTTITTYLSIMF